MQHGTGHVHGMAVVPDFPPLPLVTTRAPQTLGRDPGQLSGTMKGPPAGDCGWTQESAGQPAVAGARSYSLQLPARGAPPS